MTDYTEEFTPGNPKAAALATGAKQDTLLMVPIDKLVAPVGLNVRVHDAAYEDRIEEVTASILANGFYRHMPLSGYATKEGINVVGGFTRLEAAKRAIAAGAPLETLPVVLKPAGTSMADLTLALAVDNTGAPLKPYERGIVVKRLVGYGWPEERIAERMNVTESYVKSLLYLHGLPDPIQQMVIRGETSAGNAIDTARKHGPAEAVEILQAALAARGVGGGLDDTTLEAEEKRPRRAGVQTAGIPGKKTLLAAIDYAINLPGNGIDFLVRWRKGEKDAMDELKTSLKQPKPVKKRGRKSKDDKAAEAALLREIMS